MLGFHKLKVIKAFSSDVATHMISEDEANHENEDFKVGEVLEVDILDETDDRYTEIQFGDGSMMYQIPKDHFEVLEAPEED